MVPLNERALHYLLSKPKHLVDDEWRKMGRKKLVTLKNVTNVVFNKAKTNLGIGVPEDETSDIMTD